MKISNQDISFFVEKVIEANLFGCMNKEKIGNSYVDRNPRKVRAELFLKIAYGSEIGLTPIRSLSMIDIIKGNPGLSAKAKLIFSRADPSCIYFDIVESSEILCKVETKRRRCDGSTKVSTLTFGIEQARKRGLLKNPIWGKMPETMLKWRAVAALADQEYAGAWGGVYSTEELGDFKDVPKTELVKEDTVLAIEKEDTVFAIAKEADLDRANVRRSLFATIGVFGEARRADIYSAVKWKSGIESFSDSANVNQAQIKNVSELTKWFSGGDERVLDVRTKKLVEAWRKDQSPIDSFTDIEGLQSAHPESIKKQKIESIENLIEGFEKKDKYVEALLINNFATSLVDIDVKILEAIENGLKSEERINLIDLEIHEAKNKVQK